MGALDLGCEASFFKCTLASFGRRVAGFISSHPNQRNTRRDDQQKRTNHRQDGSRNRWQTRGSHIDVNRCPRRRVGKLKSRRSMAERKQHTQPKRKANHGSYQNASHANPPNAPDSTPAANTWSLGGTATATMSQMDLVQIQLARKTPAPKPEWLKARAPVGENYHSLKRLARSLNLHTVCESAQCPNIGECWHHKTATFMMLGNLCTRRCGFCAVPKGRPEPIDFDEPRRVAEAIATLGLEHAVITSVNRDDDLVGGARVFAMVIKEIRRQAPGCRTEVLIPDFQGNRNAIQIVVDARPDVLNHNTESVPRLYRAVRSGARYERTLELLRFAKELNPHGITKSGVMVGLGEETHELLAVFRDLAAVGCDILTIGQYLRPSRNHLPMARLYTPREFVELKAEALTMGFRHVESGPLVRSSYHAHEQAERLHKTQPTTIATM
jgi:lipoyl synthase